MSEKNVSNTWQEERIFVHFPASCCCLVHIVVSCEQSYVSERTVNKELNFLCHYFKEHKKLQSAKRCIGWWLIKPHGVSFQCDIYLLTHRLLAASLIQGSLLSIISYRIIWFDGISKYHFILIDLIW